MTDENLFGDKVKRLDELFVRDQPKLRQLASALKRSDRSATLNVTALVNQAYLKLRQGTPDLESQLHLRRTAGRAMRQILADAARARASQKRGGDGSIRFICLNDVEGQFFTSDRELIALDAALSERDILDLRQKEIVECYFFGGLNWQEIADCLGISPATVHREWRFARLILKNYIEKSC